MGLKPVATMIAPYLRSRISSVWSNLMAPAEQFFSHRPHLPVLKCRHWLLSITATFGIA